MANGPLGGFMPTPPSPGQPPQVKLETSAESRGAFNKFLGTLPRNGAIAPIQTGVVASSTAPVSPVTSNVNIFQPQMSQMAPMAPMPMMPPAQPVQNFFMGGAAMSGGGFSDADIGSQIDSFDSGQEDPDDNFDEGFTEEEDPDRAGDYQTDESGIFTGTGGDDDPAPVVDTRPRTNIRNVGPTSNLRFDPQFTADLLGRQFGDSNIAGFMSKDDFAQTRQGGATGSTSTVGLPSLGLGQNLLTAKPTVSRQDVLTAANRLSDIAPAASVPLAPTSPFFDRDLLDDPLGLGIRTGFGPVVDAIEAGRARARAFPSAGTPVASLRGGIDRLSNLENQARIADADPLAVDVIGAIRSGAAGIPFTNNPGALKQGREDLTTEVVKSLPSGSRLSQDNLAPAIFNTLEAGIDGIDRQLSLYANKPDANITTPAALANTYLGSGNKENSARNRAAYIDAIKNVAGESFDLNNPTTRSNISKAIATQEFGSAGAKVMDDIRGARTILDNFNLDQLRLNEPLTSNVDQLATLDPIQPSIDQGIIPVGEFDVRDRPLTQEEFDRQRNFLVRDARDFLNARRIPGLAFDPRDVPVETNRQRIDREQRAIQDRGGRPTFVLGPNQPGVNVRGALASRLASVLPDQALETLEGRRDRQLRDQVFDIDTRSIQPLSQSAQVQELLNRGARAQEISNIQRALDRDTVAEDLDRPISFVDSDPVADSTATTDLTRGPDVSVVGSDVVPSLEVRDIVGDVTQERVADILSRPDRFKNTFTIGDKEFPNIIATLANKVGSLFDRRLFDAIVKKGLDAVVDPDTGRIIGAKDEFGNLIEGRNLSSIGIATSDNEPSPIVRPRTPKPEEDEKPSAPNVFGGGTPRTLENIPTVVSSPFQARNINFRPVGFDAGNLNKLIERITGVPSPRRMQEGGTVAAVDRFLSKVA